MRRLEPKRALPGQEEAGHFVGGYEVIRSIGFDNQRGFAIAHNPASPEPYVTWQFKVVDGQRDFYWGRYCETEKSALGNYRERVTSYTQDRQVKEVPQDYLRSAELDTEQNYNMVGDGLINNIEPSKPDLTDGQTYEEIRELAPQTLPGEIHSGNDEKPSLLGKIEHYKTEAPASGIDGPVKDPEPEL